MKLGCMALAAMSWQCAAVCLTFHGQEALATSGKGEEEGKYFGLKVGGHPVFLEGGCYVWMLGWIKD